MPFEIRDADVRHPARWDLLAVELHEPGAMLVVGVEHGIRLAAGLHHGRHVADHLRVERLSLRRVVRPELRPTPAAIAHRPAERALRLCEDQRRAVRVLQDRELAPTLDLGDIGADRRTGRLRGGDRLLCVGDVDRGEPGRLGYVRDPVLDLRDARERRAVAAHHEVTGRTRVDLPAEEAGVEADRGDRVLALELKPVDLARGLAVPGHHECRGNRGARRPKRYALRGKAHVASPCSWAGSAREYRTPAVLR